MSVLGFVRKREASLSVRAKSAYDRLAWKWWRKWHYFPVDGKILYCPFLYALDCLKNERPITFDEIVKSRIDRWVAKRIIRAMTRGSNKN